MKLMASMHAYDVLENVQINVLVRSYPDYAEGPSELELLQALTIRGEGITDAKAWLLDVLTSLAETL